VVDNNSVDGSIAMLYETFPQINLIENKENLGFSKANNQALIKAEGEYVLILNPDTLIEEDTFIKCIDYMDANPLVGALGPKIINGEGKFLVESKRALPTPKVAFYKIFGLSALFPKSKRFGQYNLSYLPENKTNEVEILAGAFMFMRKELLDQIGYFDERFFMYGEDIDLSYRIMKAGFKNIYFPETTVIHYKGESTKKGSLNYVYIFYKAMKLFADKHFSAKNALWYSIFIDLAIYLRAGISILRRLFVTLALPVFDFLVIFLSYALATEIWELVKWENQNYYPSLFKLQIIPLYAFVLVIGLIIKGNYRRIFYLYDILAGLLLGGVLVVFSYAFIAENLRFSRAVIALGFILSFLLVPFNRLFFSWISGQKYQFRKFLQTKLIIIGKEAEINRVEKIIKKYNTNATILGYISDYYFSIQVLGTINKLEEIAKIWKPDELIFCSADVSASTIIKSIHLLANEELEFKIAPQKTVAMLSKHSGFLYSDFFSIEADSLARPYFRIQKRIFDIIFALFFLLFSPIFVSIQKEKYLFKNIMQVLLGKKTWIGPTQNELAALKLPHVKQGILNYAPETEKNSDNEQNTDDNYLIYSKNYSLINDLFIIFMALNKLGNNQ
jgi:GT2 family glycosyltransferase